MSVAARTDGDRRGAASDPHIVELGKLMLARAPKLGKAMADLLCGQIDAYRDGSVVTKAQVAESCVANVTFIFDSLAGGADVDVSPAEHTGTARALSGVPLPAVMTPAAVHSFKSVPRQPPRRVPPLIPMPVVY